MNIKEENTLIQMIDEKYNHLSIEERKEIYALYFNEETQEELKKQLESIVFYKKPPTPEEFLDPANGWLPPDSNETMYPWVKKELLEVLNKYPYPEVVAEYGCTRIGKTFLAIHLMLYIIVYFHHLREPTLYYGLSSLTELALYIISFNYDKTRELYLRPLFKIMEKSPRFVMVKFQDQVAKKQKEFGRGKIVYSKAATTGEVTLSSGLQIQLGNDDALAFVGANILVGFVSEISFWCENAGASEERIYRLYTDLKERIKATVGNQYLAFLYLDSSANTTESLIEKHILSELRYRESTHFSWHTRWEALPQKAKKWQKTGETFKVITGNGSVPAKIVESPIELEGIPTDLIIDVPIDFYNEFKDNLIKSIKDIAGRPTAAENKFITDVKIIDNIFNNTILKNVEGALVADSTDLPEGLLWNQIKDMSFYKRANGSYEILRAPREPRFVGIDLSFALHGDVTGLTILHKEFDVEKKEVVYVVDLSCAITAREKSINIEAVPKLLVDLLTFASVPIKYVFADTFHSEGSKQTLERAKVEFMKQSVDKDVTAYQTLSTIMNNGLVKAGKNIFLKNNLNCLLITREEGKGKEKIDHPKGRLTNTYLGDWENSKCGTFAKDVSDSLAQAVYGAYSTLYIPSTIYQEENKKFSAKNEDNQERIQRAYNQLHKFY